MRVDEVRGASLHDERGQEIQPPGLSGVQPQYAALPLDGARQADVVDLVSEELDLFFGRRVRAGRSRGSLVARGQSVEVDLSARKRGRARAPSHDGRDSDLRLIRVRQVLPGQRNSSDRKSVV